MNPLTRAMAKITDLTRSGRLQEATALIQLALKGRDRPEVLGMTDAAIEGQFTRLETQPPPQKSRQPRGRTDRRTSLAETLRNIAAGGMPRAAAPTQDPSPMPAGARFLTLSHGSAIGRRDYRLYIPANRPATAMPFVVMLHGCTQSPEDFAAGTGMNPLAEEFGWLVAYPAQASGTNMQKCWNWFRPEDQMRDQGEPALIAGITRDILRDHVADPAKVYVAGLSAGGALAAVVAAAYPDMFSAVGVHSGLPVGAAQDVASAFAAMRNGAAGRAVPKPQPTITCHGLADATVHPGNGRAVMAQYLHSQPGLTQTTTEGTSPQGRRYRQTQHSRTDGRIMAETWEIAGAGHAWAGGHASGTYTDPTGPDASRQMLTFFQQHSKI